MKGRSEGATQQRGEGEQEETSADWEASKYKGGEEERVETREGKGCEVSRRNQKRAGRCK